MWHRGLTTDKAIVPTHDIFCGEIKFATSNSKWSGCEDIAKLTNKYICSWYLMFAGKFSGFELVRKSQPSGASPRSCFGLDPYTKQKPLWCYWQRWISITAIKIRRLRRCYHKLFACRTILFGIKVQSNNQGRSSLRPPPPQIFVEHGWYFFYFISFINIDEWILAIG